MNNRWVRIQHAKIIGSFFLLAFFAYGGGRFLFESKQTFNQYMGAMLILLNSVLVLFIGILLKKTLQKYNDKVGNIYLFTRIFEAIALASIVLKLFLKTEMPDDIGYFLAMLVLGLGSIPMCYALYKHNISPTWLALWGIVGYLLFSFGFMMELWGKEWSMFFLIPAGLWEITFGLWLILRKNNQKIQEK